MHTFFEDLDDIGKSFPEIDTEWWDEELMKAAEWWDEELKKID